MKRCFLVVIDSLGVGEAPDAKEYGDVGTNTLANVAKYVDGVNLPGGGYKKSGYGRDGGIDSLYSYGQTKRVSKRLK